MKKKTKNKLGITNMNGLTEDDESTCGLQDMNCLEKEPQKDFSLTDMNALGKDDDTTCALQDMNCSEEEKD